MRPSRRSTESSRSSVSLSSLLSRAEAERGSASLEFLTVGVLLLVPLVYLVLALASIQGGALGVEGAARQAARVAVTAPDGEAADAAVERAVAIALADYGIDAGAASVVLSCDPADCSEPGTRVSVSVTALVTLPLVPDVLSLSAIGSVPIESTATQTVSRFARSAP
jgi:hypothetical protein